VIATDDFHNFHGSPAGSLPGSDYFHDYDGKPAVGKRRAFERHGQRVRDEE